MMTRKVLMIVAKARDNAMDQRFFDLDYGQPHPDRPMQRTHSHKPS